MAAGGITEEELGTGSLVEFGEPVPTPTPIATPTTVVLDINGEPRGGERG